jgi:RNA polymerase sigma-70 factor, ECF subfamily
MHTTPRTLLEQLKQPRQAAAWDRFVDLYTPLLYYWARRLGLRTEDASDLVQEVFLILVRKLPEFTYDRHKSFRNWLRTIAHNKWREVGRRQGRQPVSVNSGALAEPAAPAGDTFAEVEYRRLLAGRALALIQAQFEAATWKAFWECVVADRPPAEVAQELGITLNAVYIAKSRVLTCLRRDLDGLMD